jgi:hypothetical protein
MVGGNGQLFINILETDNQIQRKILEAIALETNKRISKNRTYVLNKLKSHVRSWLEMQPEISDLRQDGVGLNAELGIEAGRGKFIASTVVDAAVRSIETKVTKVNRNLKGGFVFNFQPKNLINLLSLPEASIVTEKGTSLDWLKWLLTMGDTPIIFGYDFVPTPGQGRSGGGTMIGGSMWRVQPEYSGTISDNFITRSLLGKEKILEETLKRLLK